jgi:hypothetical protein
MTKFKYRLKMGFSVTLSGVEARVFRRFDSAQRDNPTTSNTYFKMVS